jgi:hypothetical protein
LLRRWRSSQRQSSDDFAVALDRLGVDLTK